MNLLTVLVFYLFVLVSDILSPKGKCKRIWTMIFIGAMAAVSVALALGVPIPSPAPLIKRLILLLPLSAGGSV